VADWRHFTDENLARRGRHLVKTKDYALASEALSEYCSRMIADDRPIGASVMAAYGVAIGMTGNLKEGLATCQQALAADRRSPDIWAALARLTLVSGDRKKAVDAVARGLKISPRHGDLLELQEVLGVRQRPPVPFLERGNPVNVRIGRALKRMNRRPKKAGLG